MARVCWNCPPGRGAATCWMPAWLRGAKWKAKRNGSHTNITLERDWQLQNLTNWQKEAN